jgi:cell shape-determining protein MreC
MKNTCSSVNLNLNDGATVEGKSTGQNFYETFINTEDDYVCLKLFLQGTNECVENYYATENKNLKKQIEEAKRKIQIDDLIEENKRLREELNRLKR